MPLVSGLITIFGYLLAEGLLYSFPTALTSVPFSIIQEVGSAIIYYIDEIKKAIDEYDFTGYNGEVIFCGYGEPTFAYDNLIKTCKYIHEKLGLKVRLNTNGLSDLLNKKPTAKELCENTDKISISLNEYSSEKYCELCAPAFGEKSFDAIIKFAKECKQYGQDLRFSVVDVIPQEDIEKCRELADSLGIPLRVRAYVAD